MHFKFRYESIKSSRLPGNDSIESSRSARLHPTLDRLLRFEPVPFLRFGMEELHKLASHPRDAYVSTDSGNKRTANGFSWSSSLRRVSFHRYTRVNKNPSAWNFLSPKPEITCGTVAIIIRIVLLSPYLRIRAVSLSSIHYNQSHRVYINRRRQYICLIWN